MKIIFLDIDGVLNNGQFLSNVKPSIGLSKFGHFAKQVDANALNLLWEIVTKTNAKIVISSTWRYGKSVEWFVQLFKELTGKDFPIIGKTPEKDDMRGNEIAAWLRDVDDVTNFVILDDDSDFLDSQMGNLVKTSFETGLNANHVVKCIDILNS